MSATVSLTVPLLSTQMHQRQNSSNEPAIKWHGESSPGTQMAATIGAIHLFTAYIPL